MLNTELRTERGEIIKRMRHLLDFAESHKRDMSVDEDKEYKELDKRCDEIDKLIERSEKLGRREDEGKRVINPFPGYATEQRKLNDGGFSGLGEFLHSIAEFRKEGKRDDRLEQCRPDARAQSMGTGAEGGFNIPEQFIPDLLQVQPQDAIVWPRATVLPVGDPPDAKISIPALNQTAAQNIYGGVAVYHTGEAVTLNETSANFKQVSLEPKKLGAYLIATTELLNNWQACDMVLSGLLRKALMGAFDTDALRGDGVNKAQGIATAPCRITVSRAGAGAITYADLYEMYARFKQSPKGVWLVSPTVIPQLLTIKDSSNRVLWLPGGYVGPNIAEAIPGTLFGYPVVFCDRLPALGTEADVILADLSMYLVKPGSGPTVDISKELLFLTDRVVYRCTWRVDGKPWLTEPIPLEGSTANTLSPFVTLSA